jgi:hypothetical protein
LLAFFCAVNVYCGEGWNEKTQEKIQDYNDSLAGKGRDEVLAKLGKPDRSFGKWPNAIWRYRLEIPPFEASRYSDFSVSFVGGAVRHIAPSIHESLFESKSGLIGTFPGAAGPSVLQGNIMAGLEAERPPEKLTQGDEIRILGETVKRLEIAARGKESVRIPVNCDYARLLREVCRRQRIELTVVQHNGLNVLDLNASREDFESTLLKLTSGGK